MVLEFTRITNNVRLFVTRICDDCHKEERARMSVVFKGRIRRKKNVDLCRKCACARKNKPENSWPSGEKSHLWKGGLRKSRRGMRRYTGVKGRYIYEHRNVMQKHLKRNLRSKEIVHHIDMDTTNNQLENLYLFRSQSEHMQCHYGAEMLFFGLLQKYIWFDLLQQEYVLSPIKSTTQEVDLEFLRNKHVHIFRRRLSNGTLKSYRYYNEKNSTGYYKRYVHIQIAQKMLGRSMFSNERVHHVNGDTLDNSCDNLVVTTNARHAWLHRCSIQQAGAELYRTGIVLFDHGQYILKGL